MDLDFTPRSVAKDVLSAAISMKTAQLTKDAITDHTQFESDSIIVKLSSGVVGGYVAHKLKPVTNKMVDKTADFIVAKREARKAKKENTTE